MASSSAALEPVEPVARPPWPGRAEINEALALLRSARRPVAYVGGGVGMAGAVDDLRAFVETTGMPTVTTLKGLGALPTEHPLFLGMLGMHGTKAANLSIQGADLLVAVGVRFDDRATGKLAEFAPHAKVIHFDVDPAEVGKLRAPEVALVGDVKPGLAALSIELDIAPWRDQCAALRAEHAWRYDAPGDGVYAPRLLSALALAAPEGSIVSCDVGQHQMWVAQHWRHERPEWHLSSGGLGTMGFGLPAAVGAQLAHPEAMVINVAGDGSFMMNVQELQTLKRYGIPVKMLVLDNEALGLVRQWQDLFFDGRRSEVDLSDNPDFVALAEVFGISGMRAWRAQQEADVIDFLLHSDGPALAHVLIDPKANVWPLVPPGKSNAHMMDGDP